MERLSLQGKVAIITGGNSGLGKATVILFIRRGAKVTIGGRNEAKLQETVEECKKAGAKDDQVLAVAGDLTTESCRQELVKKTVEYFGQLDILVNNAGTAGGEPLRDITESGLDYLMDILFRAPIFLSKAALPHLVKTKGCIVNVSSAITTENLPGNFAYNVSKTAIDKFTEFAALEYCLAGVRVNSVKPGIVPTQIFKIVLKDDSKVEEFLEIQKGHSMLGRNGEPWEVAEMIAFLSSEAASYVTAQHFVVDGGRNKHFHHGVVPVYPGEI